MVFGQIGVSKEQELRKERDIQNEVCRYLQLAYPAVAYRTDKDGQYAKGGALWDKARQKGKKGFPDVVIAKSNGKYGGLVLELKNDGVQVYKKDGTLRSDEHLADQKWWLDWFASLGCYSSFAIGFDEARKYIDDYFKGNL